MVKKIVKKGNAVALSHDVDVLLKGLVTVRLDTGSFINSKVDIVADLIIKAHKKECK